MKPENAARKGDYVVSRGPYKLLSQFIKEHHYAKGCANTATIAFGLYRSGTLVGAALWMPPTKVCAQSVAGVQWKNVLSLSRLAIAPGEPTNAASIFIGACIRDIRKEGRWSSLVTYADGSQGHTGTIYKATNWQYIGVTKPEPRWVDSDGRQVSRKSTKSRNNEQMKALGYRLDGKYSKHKFVMHLTFGQHVDN